MSLLNSGNLKKSDKKEIVTMSQTIERYLYFTTKGIQKAYYVKDDKEFIVAFTYPFAFTCIPELFLDTETIILYI